MHAITSAQFKHSQQKVTADTMNCLKFNKVNFHTAEDMQYLLDHNNIPRWSQQRVVHQYAFRPVCTRDSTCRWQGRTADQGAPLVIDRNDFGCTDKSVSINSQQMAQYIE